MFGGGGKRKFRFPRGRGKKSSSISEVSEKSKSKSSKKKNRQVVEKVPEEGRAAMGEIDNTMHDPSLAKTMNVAELVEEKGGELKDAVTRAMDAEQEALAILEKFASTPTVPVSVSADEKTGVVNSDDDDAANDAELEEMQRQLTVSVSDEKDDGEEKEIFGARERVLWERLITTGVITSPVSSPIPSPQQRIQKMLQQVDVMQDNLVNEKLAKEEQGEELSKNETPGEKAEERDDAAVNNPSDSASSKNSLMDEDDDDDQIRGSGEYSVGATENEDPSEAGCFVNNRRSNIFGYNIWCTGN